MERSAQVWQIVDADQEPWTKRFPRGEFHKLVLDAQKNRKNRSWVDEDGTRTLLQAFPSSIPHFALHTIRKTNLPAEEADGEIIDLSIPKGHGLAEGTHFLFYPRNIVLCLYNHQGPRISRLGDWIENRLGIEIDFSPVYRPDSLAIINQMNQINSISFSIDARQLSTFDERIDENDTNSIFKALRDWAVGQEVGGTVNVSIGIGRGKNVMPQRTMSKLINEVKLVDRRKFRGAKISGKIGDDSKLLMVDLLKDQLVVKATVDADGERTNKVKASVAYEVLNQAYEDFKSQIETSVDKIPVEPKMKVPTQLIPLKTRDKKVKTN